MSNVNSEYVKAIRDFATVLKDIPNSKPSPYDTQAEVLRIEDNTAWVHIPGGVDETPVMLTSNAKPGDIVQVRISGGRAWLYGNQTSPPTDDTVALGADKKASNAEVVAGEAQDIAGDANYKAIVAKDTAEAILVYDHSYVIETVEGELTAIFTAAVFQGGKNIVNRFQPQQFTWYLKSEDSITGATDKEYLGYGYTVSVKLSDCGYGSEVIGIFTVNDDSQALTYDESNLTDSEDTNYTVRASGESVRVRDLTVSTSILPQDKLLVVGVSDEHLISIEDLQSSISVSDYSALDNKPQIEGVTLSGNKTFEDLSLTGLTNTELEELLL